MGILLAACKQHLPYGDSDGPWRYLVSGLMDEAADSIGWQPLSAEHDEVRRLERWLPAAEWLQFPVWVQTSLQASLQRRLAATALSPSETAEGCSRMRPPLQLQWTPLYRMWAAGYLARDLTFDRLVTLVGLDPRAVRVLLAEMVAGGDFLVGEQDGEPCYSLRYWPGNRGSSKNTPG